MSAAASEANPQAGSGSGGVAPWSIDPAGWDWPLLGVVVTLVCIGLVMIQSASSGLAQALTGGPYHFVVRQALGLSVGLVLAIALMGLPWRTLRAATGPAYLAAIVLLLLVLTPLGHEVNGARRWLTFGVVNVQPSELAKLALVGVVADYLEKNRGRLRDVVGVALPGLALLLPALVLVIFQRDFGTTLILLGLTGVLFVIAGLRWSTFAGGAGGALLVLAALIAVEPYRVRRITSFLTPFADPEGSGYQVVQAWIALATGGWTGTGLAVGVAQRGFVPEAHTDMIMAVVGEELGAVGFLAVVALLGLVVWRCFRVGLRAPDLFGMLAATGVGAMFAAQAIINIGVVGGMLPAKGLVLPFLSYGASAAVVNVVAVGLVLRVAMETRRVNARRVPETMAEEAS